jgi:SpoVK/Ycf46/Vps4 family AAA+-type ATPase
MLVGIEDTLDVLREVRSTVNAHSRLYGLATSKLPRGIIQVVSWPTRHRLVAGRLGVRWPKGLLLHGPPGCGKTAAVHAVAQECGAVLHVLTAASVVGPFVGKPLASTQGAPVFACMLMCCIFWQNLTGEAERRLRAVFAAAYRDAQAGCNVVVFLDEVSCISWL